MIIANAQRNAQPELAGFTCPKLRAGCDPVCCLSHIRPQKLRAADAWTDLYWNSVRSGCCSGHARRRAVQLLVARLIAVTDQGISIGDVEIFTDQ